MAAAVDAGDAEIEALCDRRLALMRSLKHWPSFKNGWTRRVADVRRIATAEMTDKPVPAVAPETTPEADPADRASRADVVGAAKKAAAWTGPLGAIGAFLVSAADMPQPIHWAIAGAIVILAATGAVLLVREAAT